MAGTFADPIDLTAEADDEAGPSAPSPAAAAAPGAAAGAAAGMPRRAKVPAEEEIVGGAKRPPVKEPTVAEGRERMHRIIRRFGLDPASVDAFLSSTGSLIAGGAALHAWMGLPVEEFSADLDFFVGEAHWKRLRELLEGASYAYRPFQRQGETAVPDPRGVMQEKKAIIKEMSEMGYPPELNGIVQVLDFVRGEGAEQRKAQIVVCLAPEAAPEGFDLSASATKYDGRELSTAFPWLTRRWLMFWQWENQAIGRGHQPVRQAKYEKKGFTLLPDGGPRIKVPDDPYGPYDPLGPFGFEA